MNQEKILYKIEEGFKRSGLRIRERRPSPETNAVYRYICENEDWSITYRVAIFPDTPINATIEELSRHPIGENQDD